MTDDDARREGELSELSLIDAVHDEVRRRGEGPLVLVVGTPTAELAALRILRDRSPLSPLRAGAPAVELDPALGTAWELRRAPEG